jgi:dTDP-4-dehydrorhamnose reductase
MRIAVTGKNGQLASALAERGASAGETILLAGRPELDLEKPETIWPALSALAPDAIINAGAYTAVDQAETEPERAIAINGRGAGAVAEAAARLKAPLIHISTDYVFDGSLDRAYREDDPINPLGVYGASKLEGEQRVRAAAANSAILRTAWVYSPFGKNFVRTMLRLAEGRDEVSVVADQCGSPTNALSLADMALAVARNLHASPDDRALRGVFHAVDAGEASWAEFATAIFECSGAVGGPSAKVRPIPTSDYPTPAKRPANSRLATDKIRRVHGFVAPHWRASLSSCVLRLVAGDYSERRIP